MQANALTTMQLLQHSHFISFISPLYDIISILFQNNFMYNASPVPPIISHIQYVRASSIEYNKHILIFIHLFNVFGILVYFHKLTVINRIAMTIAVHISFQNRLS